MAGNYYSYTGAGQYNTQGYGSGGGYALNYGNTGGYSPSAAASYTTGYQTPTTQVGSNLNSYSSGSQSGYYAPPQRSQAPSSISNSLSTSISSANKGSSSSHQSKTANYGYTSNSSVGGRDMYSGYDAAVFAAASNYLGGKNSVGGGIGGSPGQGSGSVGSGGLRMSAGRGNIRGSFPKRSIGSVGDRGALRGGGSGQRANAAAVQLHYCETCKVSCAGAQAFQTHMEGQKHKKREASLKGENVVTLSKSKTSYKCELCAVISSSEDAYNAHVRGAKHQRILKLHQTLGKPIPNSEPTIIPPQRADGAAKDVETGDNAQLNVVPVGESYVEPTVNEKGEISQYHCKLCDCKFNDMLAKDMHLKGRRHRLQYKKKVDPQLEVEGAKGNPKRVKRDTTGLRRELARLREQELWNMRARYEAEMQYLMSVRGANRAPLPIVAINQKAGGTIHYDFDADRHILHKHHEICPTPEKLETISNFATTVETALKGVSDAVAEEDKLTEKLDDVKTEETVSETHAKEKERLLKGVMRIGNLAKGLLLCDDDSFELVVITSAQPTKTLLNRIASLLPKNLGEDEENRKYQVTPKVDEGIIAISTFGEPKLTCTIMMAVNQQSDNTENAVDENRDSADVLHRAKCLEAISLLLQAKWFQARCSTLNNSLITLRILRYIRNCDLKWKPLSLWAMEVLVEKALSGTYSLSPSDCLKRFLELISSGILLPGGPGLADPCMKEPTDVVGYLTGQERENLTAYAQLILRRIHYKKIHEVLGMDRLPKQERGNKRTKDEVMDTDDIGQKEKSANEKDKSESEPSAPVEILKPPK